MSRKLNLLQRLETFIVKRELFADNPGRAVAMRMVNFNMLGFLLNEPLIRDYTKISFKLSAECVQIHSGQINELFHSFHLQTNIHYK